MIINTRIWVIAGALVIVMVFVLAGLLGVKPQLDSSAASDLDRANVETGNVQQQAELARLRTESEQADAIRAEVDQLQKLIPAEANLDDFIGELAALQVQHGVTIAAYSSLEEALFAPSEQALATLPPSISSNNFTTIGIQLSIAGPRANTMAFIDGLQKGSRLFLPTTISVSETDTVDITGIVYRLLDTPVEDPNAAAAPVDGAAAE
jgi:Tfp pilus assembly protein PilO